MDTWAYLTRTFAFDHKQRQWSYNVEGNPDIVYTDTIDAALNSLGVHGWELVSLIPQTFYMYGGQLSGESDSMISSSSYANPTVTHWNMQSHTETELVIAVFKRKQ